MQRILAASILLAVISGRSARAKETDLFTLTEGYDSKRDVTTAADRAQQFTRDCYVYSHWAFITVQYPGEAGYEKILTRPRLKGQSPEQTCRANGAHDVAFSGDYSTSDLSGMIGSILVLVADDKCLSSGRSVVLGRQDGKDAL